MKTIVIGSKNPVKIACVEKACETMFEDVKCTFVGEDVSSDVPSQPVGEEQTRQGAINRAHNVRKLHPDVDLSVGIEGGITFQEYGVECFAWVYILGMNEQHGQGRTGSFIQPPKVEELLKQGIELGAADDMVFNQENTKQKNGSVGLLTNDKMTRTDFYVPAVMFALIPFVNEELYPVPVHIESLAV